MMVKLAILIICVSMLAACAVPKQGSMDDYSYMIADASCNWRDNAAEAIYTVAIVNGEMHVVHAVSDSGERYEILSSGWKYDTFSWSVEIPSTGYILKYEVMETDGDRMHTKWSNQYDSGTETLTIVEGK